MEPSIYVGLSGQLALQRRLDTIANNVANSSTPGFRAENITFDSMISRSSVAYSGPGKGTFSPAFGRITQTENPLDVAIQSDGFMAISAPGGTVYTRDGRMRVSASGDLESIEGHPVLDNGGGPIQINMARGPVQIGRDGAITQNGDRIATLGLYRLAAEAKLSRGAGAGFTSDIPAQSVVDFNSTGFLQGYIEGANVNPVLEMTRLISVTRTFDAVSAALDQSDKKISEAIRTLSGSK